jgi:hypothetical protein
LVHRRRSNRRPSNPRVDGRRFGSRTEVRGPAAGTEPCEPTWRRRCGCPDGPPPAVVRRSRRARDERSWARGIGRPAHPRPAHIGWSGRRLAARSRARRPDIALASLWGAFDRRFEDASAVTPTHVSGQAFSDTRDRDGVRIRRTLVSWARAACSWTREVGHRVVRSDSAIANESPASTPHSHGRALGTQRRHRRAAA